MHQRLRIAPAIAASFLLAVTLAGCGASSPAYAPSAYGRDFASAPASYGSQTAIGIPQGYTAASAPSGSPATPGGPAESSASQQQLTALVSHVQNGEIFGLGDFVATVLVSNPSDVTLTGTLTVTFMDSGQPTSDVQTLDLSLTAGQAQNFTFTDTTWSTDDVKVHITTQPPDPTSGSLGGGSSFGL